MIQPLLVDVCEQIAPACIVQRGMYHWTHGYVYSVAAGAEMIELFSKNSLAPLLAGVALAACQPLGAADSNDDAPRTGSSSAQRFAHVVDLTHTLDSAFPYIPIPGLTFPFALEPIATLEANGVAANKWTIHEHLATQIDAPNHFAAGGRGLHELRADELIVPVVVIDIRGTMPS